MSALAISAEKLVRSFPGPDGNRAAVDGVDLQIEHGEIYGFLGPNGAGKSTTVRMLVTLLAPTAGDAFVNGHSVRTDPERVRLTVGVALQEAALDQLQTGAETLRLQGRLYGLTSGEMDRRLSELGELIDLGDALNERVSTYSGGMRRRLDLAAALVHDPDVLFLDEPTTGLDPVSRAAVWDEVRRLNAQLGTTVFLTTQYLEEADQLADRVGIISSGRIAAEGTPAELKRRVGDDLVLIRTAQQLNGSLTTVLDRLRALDGVQRAEVRTPAQAAGSETGAPGGTELLVATPSGGAVVGRVALALEQAGVVVDELTLRTPTLDDVFLQVTGNAMTHNDSPSSGPSADGATNSPIAPTASAKRTSRKRGKR
ncbi:ATP-binding cassette domain-containing protein [Nakamurella sp. GG22]